MKKHVFCIVLCLCLLLSVSAQAWEATGFYRRGTYGALETYQNIPFDYELGMYSQFIMVDDDTLDALWKELDQNRKPGDDEVYDMRIWYSADGRYQFEVQVKAPTYDSFGEELISAPDYLSLVKADYPPESHVKMLHDGILHKTPSGTMLETALSYDVYDADGNAQSVVFLYYDIYLDGVEYCFCIHAYDGDYTAAQALVDEVAQSVRLKAFSAVV